MDRPLVAVVLAGGTGTRLYPASSPERPKQFRRFGGDRTLLQETVARTEFADETYVLTAAEYAETVREQVPTAAVLSEPAARDTGPALVYAAHRLREQRGECVMVTLPSDHDVSGDLAGPLRTAARTARETGGLVTLGVEPTRPATGYGYIVPGAGVEGAERVDAFVEKPDEARARECIDAGAYWNTGMFAWTPGALLDATADSPLAAFARALDATDPATAYESAPATSVDYAILERTDAAYVVGASFAWDDLGTWDALGRVRPADERGNVWLGDGLAVDAANCVVAGDGHVSLVGVDDLVVASYGDRTLVVPRAESERVRAVVDALDGE